MAPTIRWKGPVFRGTVAVLIVCATLFAQIHTAAGSNPTAVPAAGGPNVLIILTDDQRLQGTMAVLPSVRRWFGKGGRTFPNAFDTTPLCCPSRATILTGTFAHNHGITTNATAGRHIFDQDATVERYLQDAGYRTAIFGKFFNFWRVEDDPSYFDRWSIITPAPDSNGYRGGLWNDHGTLRRVHRYSTDYIAARGSDFIEDSEADDAQPWFLELATYAPHLRAVPQARYEEAPIPAFHPTPAMEERNRSDKPLFLQADSAPLSGVAIARSRQLRTLMSVDDLVKKIARTLRRAGETRDTLAIFLSDNGFVWGEHGTRAKGYPYDPGVRVPFMMRWPGQVRAGSVDRRLVANVDVMPTILAEAGIEPDPDLPVDGRSLLDPSWTRDRMLLEYWPWNGSTSSEWASLHGKRYQYTEYYAADGTIQFREYYNLARDPWQLHNRLKDGDPHNDPDVRSLHDQLTTDRSCEGTTCP